MLCIIIKIQNSNAEYFINHSNINIPLFKYMLYKEAYTTNSPDYSVLIILQYSFNILIISTMVFSKYYLLIIHK